MNSKLKNKKANFSSAFSSLERALKGPKQSEVEVAGIIQMFEFTYETCWKYLKAWLEDQGVQADSPKKVFSEAYTARFIDDELKWLQMIEDRNRTTHTYKQSIALEILKRVENEYFPLFQKLYKK